MSHALPVKPARLRAPKKDPTASPTAPCPPPPAHHTRLPQRKPQVGTPSLGSHLRSLSKKKTKPLDCMSHFLRSSMVSSKEILDSFPNPGSFPTENQQVGLSVEHIPSNVKSIKFRASSARLGVQEPLLAICFLGRLSI